MCVSLQRQDVEESDTSSSPHPRPRPSLVVEGRPGIWVVGWEWMRGKINFVSVHR